MFSQTHTDRLTLPSDSIITGIGGRFIDEVLSLPLAEACRKIVENAPLAWVIEKNIVSGLAEFMIISGGMGIPEGLLTLPSDRKTVLQWMRRFHFAVRSDYTTWRGLDVRFAKDRPGFAIFDAFVALHNARPILTQETFEFIMCRDLPNVALGAVIRDGKNEEYFRVQPTDESIDWIRRISQFESEEAMLTAAFSKQMVAEAAPFAARVASGVYALNRVPLPKLDAEVVYDGLRLIIYPGGIVGSVLYLDPALPSFIPFSWTPTGINTTQVSYPPMAVFYLDTLLSCIWRDACVVQNVWCEQSHRRAVERPHASAPSNKSNTVVMPRRVYHYTWGRDAEERDAIDRSARAIHSVSGCYVKLPEDWQAHDAAERAAQVGWPAPPTGYTFRAPHQRGGLKVAPAETKRIICRGLQTAKILFGKEAEKS